MIDSFLETRDVHRHDEVDVGVVLAISPISLNTTWSLHTVWGMQEKKIKAAIMVCS